MHFITKLYIINNKRKVLRRHWQCITQSAYEMEHLEENKASVVAANLQVRIHKTLSLKEKF